MSSQPQRKFDYLTGNSAHDNRFEMLKLPTISTKWKASANLVPSYDKMAKETPFDKA